MGIFRWWQNKRNKRSRLNGNGQIAGQRQTGPRSPHAAGQPPGSSDWSTTAGVEPDPTHSSDSVQQSGRSKETGKSEEPGHSPDGTLAEPHSASLATRMEWYRTRLDRVADVTFQTFTAGNGRQCSVIYLKGMTDQKVFQEQVLKAVMDPKFLAPGEKLADKLTGDKMIPIADYTVVDSEDKGLSHILEGHILFLIDGEERMLSFPLSKYEKRSITESPNEAVIRGPREAFIEDLNTNLTMIRRRLRHPNYKTEQLEFGVYSKSQVIIGYIEGIAGKELVDEVKARLSRIEIDAVMESTVLEEYIEDNPFSPFPQVMYTERPDIVTQAMLDGRVILMVNGTPIALIVPVTIYMFLKSPEDYYQRYVSGTWIRWLRYFLTVTSLLLPSVYVAITTFHPESLPTNLLVTVAGAREVVPFPAIVEALLMEITFEALREAGIRIPKPVGQAVSILGALVIGQAAVQAGIVSAPMVIIVSLTGIASFVIPHFEMSLALRLLRFPIILLAGTLGMFGIAIGIILVSMHLLSLRSFGTPYMLPLSPLYGQDVKDVVVRAPWWAMKKRPQLYGTSGDDRLHYRKRPQLPREEDGD